MKIQVAVVVLLQMSFFQSLAQEHDFPYKKSKKDFVIAPLSIITNLTSDYLARENNHNLTVEEITLLNRTDENRLDRNATYFWNRSADDFSNVIFKTLPFVPIALTIPQVINKKWDNASTIGVMYFEVFFFTKGITGITKSITGRTRPYLYNTSFTPEERYNFQENGAPIGNTSFFSGHTSATFAAAVFLSKTYTDIYGKGTWSKIIWCTSLTLASATAYCRVASGEHFPTDVIVGAMVGSAIGYAIPVLHKVNPEKLTVSILPNYFSVCYKF